MTACELRHRLEPLTPGWEPGSALAHHARPCGERAPPGSGSQRRRSCPYQSEPDRVRRCRPRRGESSRPGRAWAADIRPFARPPAWFPRGRDLQTAPEHLGGWEVQLEGQTATLTTPTPLVQNLIATN